ncbi:hypothetical protein [Tenggerimyces flavus]|uniref:Uncharacterized protein n=1 Tax=Tenggerimyces flavus TaxID=1708749 RepID=A0ABV7Y5D0_9ACTN|nr:hypothetical protein [Tenggerimyces flavus]MBM7790682.1 hypothetical protein [Tenggerimyces flavus]
MALLVGLGLGLVFRDGGDGPADGQAMIISEPGPVVTVTATPAPAPTVTVPGPRVTVTVTARALRQNDDPPPSDDDAPDPTRRPQPGPDPEPAGSFPGNGMFVVNSDIQPGTYKSRPAANGYVEICIWRRLRDTSGSRDSTIDGNVAQGPATVTIKRSDGAFETRGCQDWKRVK